MTQGERLRLKKILRALEFFLREPHVPFISFHIARKHLSDFARSSRNSGSVRERAERILFLTNAFPVEEVRKEEIFSLVKELWQEYGLERLNFPLQAGDS